LTLIVLALALDVVASSRLRDVIGEIQTTIDDDLTGTGLTTRLSGVPVTQPEIRNAVEPRPTALQYCSSALGVLDWLDFRFNKFLNVMTPLIMVSVFRTAYS
jgi:hypothetical protein